MHNSEWLTDRQRKIFELFYKRGWRIEDIAAEINVNRSTVDRELLVVRTAANEVKMRLK